jgi:preprotein translocase subunit Sec61beta
MEDNEIKLYVKFPVYLYLVIVGFLVILPMFFILYNDYGIKVKILGLITVSFGIFISLVLFLVNIFKKTGYIITKEGITSFSPVKEIKYLWNQIVSYTVNGYEKKNDFYLRFYTEESLKNNGKLKPKYVINISTKLCRVNINELIGKINKIREKG